MTIELFGIGKITGTPDTMLELMKSYQTAYKIAKKEGDRKERNKYKIWFTIIQDKLYNGGYL